MASNKRSFRDDPPSASSSDYDDEVGAEDGGVDEEISIPLSPRREESDESGTESDEEPTKPNGTRVMENGLSNRGFVGNGVEGPALKRARIEAVPEGIENKPKPGQEKFQRIWSESEEIEIMKGIVEFNDRKKGNPVFDLNDLYEFLRGKISTFFTKQQLTGKMSTMKKKFMNCENRARKGSKLRPLDETFLELARKAWGSVENLGNDKNKKKMNNDVAVPDAIEKEGANASALTRWLSKELSRLSGDGAIDEGFLRNGIYLISEGTLAELHQRWMSLQDQELKLAAERAGLIREVTTLISHLYKLP